MIDYTIVIPQLITLCSGWQLESKKGFRPNAVLIMKTQNSDALNALYIHLLTNPFSIYKSNGKERNAMVANISQPFLNGKIQSELCTKNFVVKVKRNNRRNVMSST